MLGSSLVRNKDYLLKCSRNTGSGDIKKILDKDFTFVIRYLYSIYASDLNAFISRSLFPNRTKK